jgi:hypothetical protein
MLLGDGHAEIMGDSAKMMMMCSGTLQFLFGTLVCGAAGAARGVSFALCKGGRIKRIAF